MADGSETQSPNTTPSAPIYPSNGNFNPSSVPISSNDHLKPSPVPSISGFPVFPNSNLQMLPVMYPTLVPALFPSTNQDDQNNQGGRGVYMVPVLPFMGPMDGLPSGVLIPLTYNIPTIRRPNPTGGGVNGEEQGQEGRQQHMPQRHVVVRRFQFGFQLDLLLILKLAIVVFMLNQDGSKERLFFLLLFASIIYLYQTGAVAPLIRWLSQGIQREMAGPPLQQPPAVRAEGDNAPEPDGQAGGENENRPEPGRAEGINLWRIIKEIQLIVVGFITSLLPGFHNVD